MDSPAPVIVAPLPSPDSLALDSHETHARKRKRCMPVTPPVTAEDPEGAQLLSCTVNVLAVNATAISHVARLYETDPNARQGMLRAADAVATSKLNKGKLVICAVGKSGIIGQQLVAMLKSLSISSSFMHATEAVHGDLGDIGEDDTVLFISYSGRTPELLNTIQHIPPNNQIIALTSNLEVDACPLLLKRPDAILLPAPLHQSEETSFGVAAPSTSVTVALVIGQSLAISVAQKLHGAEMQQIFKKNHPGGAIGMTK
ncbi:uncharacterized protein PV09_08992 [Verruconis gallopava]|uniref:SIS domain-containing protein n=1 Tax=Verruconis gallopava TaxID=253628 RepID=A0A0D2AK38_9PEZI|nr:uncharacterized protein PV09_08992 [Verruconis gallopava]KIV99333.1 hypothetical protein PV09_08992 [Verruconis gallopava]